jgi:hypothetical protein
MPDQNLDPYEGAETEEERQAIYQKLLADHEEAEYNRRKTIYSDLIEDWKHHIVIQRDVDQRAHKNLITLASGSFGVSFAFISQIVNIETATNTVVLVVSWALFAFTIFLAILELKIESVIQDMLLDNVEKNIERGYEDKPYLEPNKRLVKWLTRIFGWIAFVSFGGGEFCLLYFVLLNTALR